MSSRKPTEEEAEAILLLVRTGWLRLELSLPADEPEPDTSARAMLDLP